MNESAVDRGLVIVVIAVALALGVLAAMVYDRLHPRRAEPCDASCLLSFDKYMSARYTKVALGTEGKHVGGRAS
jgi:hypothetical protein